MIKITCTNCQKPLSLDETKLPMREVTFPCPVCKAKLTVDRRTMENGAAPAAPGPAAASPEAEPPVPDEHENEFGAKALIVGANPPAVRQAAKLIGFLPVAYDNAMKAREYLMQELPHVVFLCPEQLTAPPLEQMQPMISLTPSDRRRTFLILVADGLKTLDGNAAFLYGVNLVVAAKDLPQFPQIYRDAFGHHERFYAAMSTVIRQMEA
ncbi:MAG: hypothetical protein WA208_12925 [Thermoanaerobaculia bacterium]